MPSRIDHVATWKRVFDYLEPLAAACAKDGWTRKIPWTVFERDLSLHRDGCRSAINRAMIECQGIYRVGIVARSADGFTIGVEK